MNGNGNGFGVQIGRLGHQKQNRMQIGQGIPDVHELSEGVPVLRAVPEVGIVQYLKYNGDLYASVFTKNLGTELPQPSGRFISRFHDDANTGAGGGVGYSSGQDWLAQIGFSPLNAISGDWEDTTQDLVSIIGKLDEIITVLRLAGIVGNNKPFNSDGI